LANFTKKQFWYVFLVFKDPAQNDTF